MGNHPAVDMRVHDLIALLTTPDAITALVVVSVGAVAYCMGYSLEHRRYWPPAVLCVLAFLYVVLFGGGEWWEITALFVAAAGAYGFANLGFLGDDAPPE